MTRLGYRVLLVAGMAAFAPAASAQDGEEPGIQHILEVGAGYGRYLEGGDNANGQYIRMTWAKPDVHDFRLDVGRQQRFGATTFGIGAMYKRLFDDLSVAVGGATSTGELAPEFSGSVTLAWPWLGFGVSVGAAHSDWTDDASNDEIFVGLERWFAHWIASGTVRRYFTEPGSEKTTAGGVGLTYYVWRQTYIGIGYDYGDVRYRLTGVGGALVEYKSRGYNLGVSRWLDDRSGVNVRLDYGDPPEVVGVSIAWFREW